MWCSWGFDPWKLEIHFLINPHWLTDWCLHWSWIGVYIDHDIDTNHSPRHESIICLELKIIPHWFIYRQLHSPIFLKIAPYNNHLKIILKSKIWDHNLKVKGQNQRSIRSPSSVTERLRRRLCNQKIAGSNPAFGHLATPFRKEI